MKIWEKEPTLVTQIVQILVTIATSFGLDLSVEQVLTVFTVCSMIAGVIIRSRVSPTSK